MSMIYYVVKYYILNNVKQKLRATQIINPKAVGKRVARAVYFLLFVSLYTVIIEVEHGQ